MSVKSGDQYVRQCGFCLLFFCKYQCREIFWGSTRAPWEIRTWPKVGNGFFLSGFGLPSWNSFAGETWTHGNYKGEKERRGTFLQVLKKLQNYLSYSEVEMASPDTLWGVSLGIENKRDSKRSGSSTESLESEDKGIYGLVPSYSFSWLILIKVPYLWCQSPGSRSSGKPLLERKDLVSNFLLFSFHSF